MIAILVAALFSFTLHAEYEIRFGPEFTFCKADMKFDGIDQQTFINACQDHLILGQPDGAKFETIITGAFTLKTFQSPNGWNFTPNVDRGVLEVQMNPMTPGNFKQYASDIQDAIFVTAANQGLFPFAYQGGGHINLDIASFRGNVLLLRNFLVDYWNHNELALGIWNYDTHNALSLSLKDQSHIAQIQEVLAKFDRGEFLLQAGEQTYPYNFLSELNKINTYATDEYLTFWHKNIFIMRNKWTDLTLEQATLKDNRIEIRAVRPQKDIYTWIKQIELIESRINFLAKFKQPIPLKPMLKVAQYNEDQMDRRILQPPVNPQKALRAFYQYVTESGHEWADHRDYIWPDWIRTGEVSKFERSKWFKQQLKSCEGFL